MQVGTGKIFFLQLSLEITSDMKLSLEGKDNAIQLYMLKSGRQKKKKIRFVTIFTLSYSDIRVSQVVLLVKNPPANAGDANLLPGLGRCLIPGEGNGNPLQYFSPGNPMGRVAGKASVHGAAKSQ